MVFQQCIKFFPKPQQEKALQHSGGADVLSPESFLLTPFSQMKEEPLKHSSAVPKSTGLLPSQVQALGVP